MNEREYNTNLFSEAAEQNPLHMKTHEPSKTHVQITFKGFVNIDVEWDESFLTWRLQTSRLIAPGVRIVIKITGAENIIEFLRDGTKEFLTNRLTNWEES